MLKLLIADDEKWICTLIKSMIDFEGLGLRLAGMAYDGEEAIRMIRELRPDVVITDIKMPCADGLQVIKAARDAGLDTKFIILSGYSTFEYAKTAVRYHVEDYLLKPVSAGQLGEALEKLCAAILRRRAQQDELHQLRGSLESTVEKVRTHLVTDIVYSPGLLQSMSMEELNAAYNFRFVSGTFQIMLLHALPLENSLSISQLLKKLDQMLRSRLAVRCCEYESLVDQHRIVILINYSDTLRSIMPEIIDYSFRATLVADQLSRLLHCALYIGLPVERPAQLQCSYKSAEEITNLGILQGTGASYSAAALPKNPTGSPALPTAEQKAQLLQTMLEGVESDVFAFCENLLTAWNSRLLERPEELDALLSAVFETIGEGCRQRGLALPGLENLRDDFFFNFRMCENRAALCLLLKETLEQLRGAIQSILCTSKSLPVSKARDYVRSHYQEKLSVESIAEQVFLSPNYFSMLFKKETGLNFSDYVTQVRLEAAKQLLMDPQYTIAQVGTAVGYPDPRYFSKLFKKVIGIKPHEYRKICALSRGIEEMPEQEGGPG